MPFSITDEYFAQPPIDEDYPFAACGQIVLLSDPALAAALWTYVNPLDKKS